LAHERFSGGREGVFWRDFFLSDFFTRDFLGDLLEGDFFADDLGIFYFLNRLVFVIPLSWVSLATIRVLSEAGAR
jgi:hypothetical protein